METGKVDNTLIERGNVYGDYKGGMGFRLYVMSVILTRFKDVNGTDMPKVQEMYFNDIIGKLSRLSVTPTHTDSWHDLAGYSLLVESVIAGEPS